MVAKSDKMQLMNITLTSGQIALLHIILENAHDDFEVYGGTQRGAFLIDYIGTTNANREWLCTVREADVVGTPLGAFNIYAREAATGREYTILSGKIVVTPRTASVPADKLSPVEYFVHVPVYADSIDVQGAAIIQGIPGPKGDKGDKGEPGEGAELTPEAIQQVVPIAWSEGNAAVASEINSIAFGSEATYSDQGTSCLGVKTKAMFCSTAVGYKANATGGIAVAIGYQAQATKNSSIAVGSKIAESVNGAPVYHGCTTEGTGSITIGAGANTLNNGDVESSNSVTIGCKAENRGADSVVIGAQAKNVNDVGANVPASIVIGANARSGSYDNVIIGVGAESLSGNCLVLGNNAKGWIYNVALGSGANAGQKKYKAHCIALGYNANANEGRSVAIGSQATANDYGATVIRSTAEDGTYTQLYFSGANTPLANTYENGEAMMGYVVRDSAGNVMTDAEGNAMVGTQKLSVLFPNNRGENAFTPAMLGLDDEWTPKPMFRPSDLDMPQDEPTEPEEYQPLPVYPIVEPEIEPLTE